MSDLQTLALLSLQDDYFEEDLQEDNAVLVPAGLVSGLTPAMIAKEAAILYGTWKLSGYAADKIVDGGEKYFNHINTNGAA